jgi:hypothetical protein
MSEMFVHRREGGPPRPRRGMGVLAGLSIALLLAHAGGLAAGEPSGTIVLGEAVPRGGSSKVQIELKAQGLFRPAPEHNKAKDGAKMPKPLSIEVQTRLIFYERILDVIDDAEVMKTGQESRSENPRRGRPRKVARHVIQAAAAINGEIRPRATSLRPEVAVLVAERRRDDGRVVVVSPAGPLTRSELELVEVAGDPLGLTDLLPSGPVGVGRSWRVGRAAAVGISGYDAISTNALEATLESFDEARARVRLRGRIEGSLQGAPGVIACDGVLSLDRRMGWIERVEINRNESRRAGPIEAGLDVKSTLTMTRHAADQPPATLGDPGLARYSLEVTPRSEMLVEYGPEDRSSFLHDRSWHVFWGDPKLVVLKRLDGGRVVAQCNLVVGPPAGRGRHQDSTQFRDEVRRVLGQRFLQYIGAGEVDGDPAGGYRFKVGVQGREGDLGVVWYYFLVASPAGDQLVVTYTLAAQDAQAFGDQDLEMIRTLRWLPARQAAGRN